MKTMEQIQRNLAFGKEGHKSLSEAIMRRLKMSRDKMSERYKQMAENEKQFAAYVPARDVDAVRKGKKSALGEHDYVSIEVPYSYAVAMTIHTYISSVFLSRSPVYQTQARHGEPEMSIQALEALLDYQYNAGKHAMPLFCGLFDPLRYGFGVVGQYWDEETVRVRKFVEETPTFLGLPVPGAKTKRVPVVEDIPGFKGVKLFNVRPQDFFPDVRLALWRFQEGEYCGRYVELPWSELYEGEAQGRYFNVHAAYSSEKAGGTISREEGASAVITLPGTNVPESYDRKPDSIFKGFEFQWKVSPSQWGLGDEGRQEIWVFTVSNNGTIVEARPSGMYHNGFSYDLFMTEPDGYNLFPVSALERIKPLNDVLSWLINSHFYNVRASLNNQFIVDPSMVVLKDVLSRTPGQVIRLKPEAMGRDVRMAIQQLPVGDVTRSHLNDAQLVELMIQRALGATDNVMGMVNTTGRKTATEVRTTTSFGVNRIKTLCELLSASGFGPMVNRQIQSVQQLYDGEQTFRLVGDLGTFGQRTAVVSPENIVGSFDYSPVDGTMPVDRYAQAQLWQSMLAQVGQMPQVVQQYDVAKIFAWVASLAGLKNVQQFKVNPQDPGMIAQQVQAGNLVPMDAAMGDMTRVPDSNRPAGMGTTG